VREGLARLDNGLAQTATLATGLRESTESIRGELARAREGLTELQSRARARESLEDETARSIHRLEQVIAGTATKGAGGENLVELVFSRLPAEWQVRNFRVGNRTCEFGLRLPNGLVLPIDSKWPATSLLEQFSATEEPAEQQRLKAQIESAVLEKAREVRKYLNPEVTLNFGVAVVPDAVFELCGAVQGQCASESVVVVAHSMFVPYLLLVFQTVLRTSRDIDIEKLAAHIETAEQSLRMLQEEVEGRLSRAITMLGNSRDDLRLQVARASSGLAAIQARTDLPAAGDGQFELPEPGVATPVR
ncbi:MAG: DNA recombination protein RmuC, partial [Hyphomicrobiales bacterium]